MTHTLETTTVLQSAEKSGRAFLEMESLKQIAINLARIADRLDERKERSSADE